MPQYQMFALLCMVGFGGMFVLAVILDAVLRRAGRRKQK